MILLPRAGAAVGDARPALRQERDNDVLMTYGSFGGSLFLIALGAILRYAVTAELAGIDLAIVGLILMIAGGVMFVLTLVMTFSARGPRDAPPPPY